MSPPAGLWNSVRVELLRNCPWQRCMWRHWRHREAGRLPRKPQTPHARSNPWRWGHVQLPDWEVWIKDKVHLRFQEEGGGYCNGTQWPIRKRCACQGDERLPPVYASKPVVYHGSRPFQRRTGPDKAVLACEKIRPPLYPVKEAVVEQHPLSTPTECGPSDDHFVFFALDRELIPLVYVGYREYTWLRFSLLFV